MSEVKSNKAWRLECENLRVEIERLRGLLREAREFGYFSGVNLKARIDAALDGATDQPDDGELQELRRLAFECTNLGLYELVEEGGTRAAVDNILVALRKLTATAQPNDALRDAVIAAYKQGASDVHGNYEPERDPDFTEAAHDYAASVTIPTPADQPKAAPCTCVIRKPRSECPIHGTPDPTDVCPHGKPWDDCPDCRH